VHNIRISVTPVKDINCTWMRRVHYMPIGRTNRRRDAANSSCCGSLIGFRYRLCHYLLIASQHHSRCGVNVNYVCL
jgi:hypothetical protein